ADEHGQCTPRVTETRLGPRPDVPPPSHAYLGRTPTKKRGEERENMILSVSQFETRQRMIDEWMVANELRGFKVAKASRPRARARWFTRIMRAAVARIAGVLRAETSEQGPRAGNPAYWPA